MVPQKKALAVIWDFDGTIVDSRRKNFNVTNKIVKSILGTNPELFPVLTSLDSYHSAHTKSVNWREFYRNSFNLSKEQVDEAGRLWTEFQLKDQTPVPLIDGVEETIKKLCDYPQGIVSQNSRENIIQYLNENNISQYFNTVIGYEEVDIARQKPLPDGLIKCVNKLVNSDLGCVAFIGDHETDVQCVLNANKVIKGNDINLKIISLGAFYGIAVDTSNWEVLPDYEITNAEMIPDIINNF